MTMKTYFLLFCTIYTILHPGVLFALFLAIWEKEERLRGLGMFTQNKLTKFKLIKLAIITIGTLVEIFLIYIVHFSGLIVITQSGFKY